MKANLHEVFSTPKAFEQGTASGEGDSMLDRESDQKNVVEKKSKALNEASDELDANLRERSVDEGSDLGINITKNFHVKNLPSDDEIQPSQPKPSKQLDRDELHQNQFIAVNQESNLYGSHNQHSAMEQPLLALESDAGSSSPFDGDLEMKAAELHIPSQETMPSSTSDSAVGASEATGNSPISLNFKDKLGHTEVI